MTTQPFSTNFITRLFVVLTVVFALFAGYYSSVLAIYHQRYVRLETKYQQLQLQETQKAR